ncbi:sialin isoform X2 [Ciona intestinalis]
MNIDEPLKSNENVPRKKFYARQRYVLASLGFMGYFLISCLRNCINVTVLSMVRWNNTETNVTDAMNSTVEKSKGFGWSSSQEGLFLGAYFYGYVCTNIMGGWLGRKFGFPIVFGLPIFISAILSIATPIAAYTSFALVIACRVLIGLLQGASVCAFQGCWSSWAPPLERSLLNSIAWSGFPFGLGFANFFAGYICGTLGWEAVFYILGGVAIGWSVVWILIVSDSPRTNRCITAEEVVYIEKSIGFTPKDMLQSQDVPWGAIMKSRSVWAIFVAHFCDNWTGNTFNAILPTFMSKIFNFNVFQSGAVMTAPYIAQVGVSILAGYITDAARQRKWISTSVARKVNTIIAQGFLNIFMIIACYCTNSTTVIVLLVVGMSFRGFTYAGHNSSPIDIAPMYAGVVFGISNTIASITGFLGPLTAGLVITDKTSISQWQTMFWINGAFGFFGSIFFACFASEVERNWAQIKDSDKETDLKTNLKSALTDDEC